MERVRLHRWLAGSIGVGQARAHPGRHSARAGKTPRAPWEAGRGKRVVGRTPANGWLLPPGGCYASLAACWSAQFEAIARSRIHGPTGPGAGLVRDWDWLARPALPA